MLCAPLHWQYAELPSSASNTVLCFVLVRKMSLKQIEKKNKKNSNISLIIFQFSFKNYCEEIRLDVFLCIYHTDYSPRLRSVKIYDQVIHGVIRAGVNKVFTRR